MRTPKKIKAGGNKYLKCSSCGEKKPDVSERACAYQAEINDIEYFEIICDDCEYEHRMAI